MFILKKSCLWILCSYLVWYQAQASSIERQTTSEKNYALDYEAEDRFYDYEAEDAAKEVVLHDSQHLGKQVAVTSSASSYPSSSDLRNLCMDDKEGDNILFECGKDYVRAFVCIDTVYGRPMNCDNITKDNFPKTLCVNTTDRVIVICESPSSFACIGATRMDICTKPEQKLCFQKDPGYIDLCELMPVASISYNLPKPQLKFNGTSKEWWKEWGESSSQYEQLRMGYMLCINEDDHLEECKPKLGNAEMSTACIDSTDGDIKLCSKLKPAEEPIELCIEANSDEVITCGAFPRTYLCFPKGNRKKPLRPCRSEHRHVCLDINGLLEKCQNKENKTQMKKYSRSGDLIGTAEDLFYENFKDEVKWKEFWHEFVYDRNYPRVTADKTKNYLCKPLGAKYDIIDCDVEPTRTTACISVMTGEIAACKEIKWSEMAIPLCLDTLSNKIILCGNFTRAFLCQPQEKTTSMIRPCRDEMRHMCVSESGMFKKCSSVSKRDRDSHSPDDSAEDDPESGELSSDGMNNAKVYTAENLIIASILQDTQYLCKSGNSNKLMTCDKDSTLNFACFAAGPGTMDACTDIRQTYLAIPLCMKEAKKVVACGKFFSAPVCYLNDTAITTCTEKDRYLCLSKKGELVRCKGKENETDDVLGHVEIQKDKCVGQVEQWEQCPEYDDSGEGGNSENRDESVIAIQPTEDINEEIDSEEDYKEDPEPCCEDGGPEPSEKVDDDREKQTESRRFKGQSRQSNVRKHYRKGNRNQGRNQDKNGDSGRGGGSENGGRSVIRESYYQENDDNGKIQSEEDVNEEYDYQEDEGDSSSHYVDVEVEVVSEEETESKPKKRKDRKSSFAQKREEFEEAIDEEHESEEEIEDGETKYIKRRPFKGQSRTGRKDTKRNISQDRNEDKNEYRNVDRNSRSLKDRENPKHDENRSADVEDETEDQADIRKTIFERINEIHKKNTHLCYTEKRKGPIRSCDEDDDLNFYCFGAKSRVLKPCIEFIEREDVVFPVCSQPPKNYLVTCDIFSNVNLCGRSPFKIASPCKNPKLYMCLNTDRGTSSSCDNIDGNSTTTHGPDDKSSTTHGPDDKSSTIDNPDEKFFRVQCSNCTIESKIRVEEVPEGYLPETEVFTFPTV